QCLGPVEPLALVVERGPLMQATGGRNGVGGHGRMLGDGNPCAMLRRSVGGVETRRHAAGGGPPPRRTGGGTGPGGGPGGALIRGRGRESRRWPCRRSGLSARLPTASGV